MSARNIFRTLSQGKIADSLLHLSATVGLGPLASVFAQAASRNEIGPALIEATQKGYASTAAAILPAAYSRAAPSDFDTAMNAALLHPATKTVFEKFEAESSFMFPDENYVYQPLEQIVGRRHLSDAVSAQDNDRLTALLDSGIEPNDPNNGGTCYALLNAVGGGHAAACKILQTHGAVLFDPAHEPQNTMALWVAHDNEKDTPEMAQIKHAIRESLPADIRAECFPETSKNTSVKTGPSPAPQ